MSGHLEVPWVHQQIACLNGTANVITAGDVVIAELYDQGGDVGAANARRIVACINALVGIDTDFLERTHAKGYASGFRKHIELETECEELRNRIAAFENGTASDCARASIKAANKLLSQRATLLAALNLIDTDKDGDGFVCKEAMAQIREAITQTED